MNFQGLSRTALATNCVCSALEIWLHLSPAALKGELSLPLISCCTEESGPPAPRLGITVELAQMGKVQVS